MDKTALERAHELLNTASWEIKNLRQQVEKQSIRLDAIDDMLCVLHGKPGNKAGGGMMSPDIVYEIERELKAAKDGADEQLRKSFDNPEPTSGKSNPARPEGISV